MTNLFLLPKPGRCKVPEIRSVHDRIEDLTAALALPPRLASALAAFGASTLAAELLEQQFRTDRAPNLRAPEAAALRNATSKRISWIHQVLSNTVEVDRDSPDAEPAAALLEAALPQGVWPIVKVPDTSRAASVAAFLRILAQPQHAGTLAQLGLTSTVARLDRENQLFAALVGQRTAKVTGAQVRAAVAKARDDMLQVATLGVVLADEPGVGPALEEAVVFPYVDMIEQKATRNRRRRKASTDVPAPVVVPIQPSAPAALTLA